MQKARILQLFNTATKNIAPFTPIIPGQVTMYACGPTVYHYAHIGNMRTYVFEDILRRTLEHAGYQVKHVMNITDVGHLQSDGDEGDDKMAIASKRESKSPWEIARFYESEFFRHSLLLGIKKPHVVARATEHIADMIGMIETLLHKGYAYISDNNVYFDISKFDRYTEFADIRLEDQQQTDRIDTDLRKRNPADFVLWFSDSKYPNQIMKWNSPWGIGFPGWHIECSAMASKHLGKHIDIHCGGIDHIRVHHTNEIAQSECCHGHQWVNYWLHGEFLTIDKGKMSKSQGGFLTVDSIINQGFQPFDYRYLLLTAHYRSALSFSYDGLKTAQNALQNLRKRIPTQTINAENPQISQIAQNLQAVFWNHIYNDLHTPKALAVAWEVAKSPALTDNERYYLIKDFDTVLGLDLTQNDEPLTLTSQQQELINKRNQARENGDWATSDAIRDTLLTQGIRLIDPKKGTSAPTTWERYP